MEGREEFIAALRHVDEIVRWHTNYPDGDKNLAIVQRGVSRLLDQDEELDRLRQIIREYVADVSDGAKFDVLVSSVPGLVSDDGQYGATS
jgi:hypothetical protein